MLFWSRQSHSHIYKKTRNRTENKWFERSVASACFGRVAAAANRKKKEEENSPGVWSLSCGARQLGDKAPSPPRALCHVSFKLFATDSVLPGIVWQASVLFIGCLLSQTSVASQTLPHDLRQHTHITELTNTRVSTLYESSCVLINLRIMLSNFYGVVYVVTVVTLQPNTRPLQKEVHHIVLRLISNKKCVAGDIFSSFISKSKQLQLIWALFWRCSTSMTFLTPFD